LNGLMTATTPERLTDRVDVDLGRDVLGEAALEQVRDAAGELGDLEPAGDLADRVGDDLAVLGGDELGDLGLALVEQLAETEEHLGALGQRGPLPRRLPCGLRGGDDLAHELGGGEVEHAGLLAGGGVEHRAGARGAALPGSAADEVGDAGGGRAHREVAGVRRALVVRRGADRVDEAQLTGGDRGTQAPVCRVEPPLEAHLDRDSGRGLEPRELDGLVETGRDRLLAEGREARPHAGEEDLGMGVGRRGDEQGVEVSPQEGVEVRGDRRTELGRDRGSRRRGRVEQDEVGDGRVGCEGLCVERADPAHANDSDAHGVRAPA
jgi:hypothetical protein